jgi:hypothetical protein
LSLGLAVIEKIVLWCGEEHILGLVAAVRFDVDELSVSEFHVVDSVLGVVE